MANHRATGRAQTRPLAVAAGTHRDRALPAGAAKVGVLGILAAATIAVPLASATAGGQPAVDASVVKAPVVAAAPAAPAAPVQLPTAAAAEVREDATASRAQAGERTSVAADETKGEKSKKAKKSAKAKKGEKAAEVENTGITVDVPDPEIVDESGESLGTKGDGYIRPVSGPVTSGYGYRVHPVLGYSKMHDGIDYGAGCGTPVHATQSGTVTAVEYHGASGQRVKIDHGNGYTSGYFHLQGYNTTVGAKVEQGDVVGYVGSTGRSTGCHLHFEIIDASGNSVNPSSFLR